MEVQKFEISIKATAEKVWQVLWNDLTYRQWTTPFFVGSYAKSDWKQGSRIYFLSPDGRGMFSRILILETNKTMVLNI
ncbi:MAG: hypothetical protein HC854_07840 [Flavobacterium sp.]|nr:hypothetical protein [Flavobacterium sp.]